LGIKMAITKTGNSVIGGTATHIVINPNATYLRTNADPLAIDAIAINLATLGIAAGDLISIEQSGEYDGNGAAAGGDAFDLVGVFSTSTTLTASSNLNRVTGAIAATNVFGAATPPFITSPTSTGGLATDIAADVLIPVAEDNLVIVPVSATTLFVTPNDSFFGDNTDIDNDFGIDIYRPMGVGLTGVGTVTITGGSEVSDGVIIGSASAGNGTLTVQSGATFTIGGAAAPSGGGFVDGNLIVGLNGTGLLTVSGGSDVIVNSAGEYVNFAAGSNAGSNGTITVTGAGSTLTAFGNNSDIVIGREGTGTLNVLAGASARTLGLVVGFNGAGNVNVSGAGSFLSLSNDNGSLTNYANDAAFLNLGVKTGSLATINITNGGIVEVRNSTTEDSPEFRMGRNLGSTAIGIIDGVGSTLNISQVGPSSPGFGGPRIVVGSRGDGTLTVRNSATINITGDKAELVVSGAGSDGDEAASAAITQSELLIQSGAVVTVDHGTATDYFAVIAGNNQFGNGAIRMSGAGSLLQTLGTNDAITVGNRGTGLLTIATGADVTSQRMFIGNDAGSNGTVTVDGAGSTIVLTSPAVFDPAVQEAGIWVGNRGNGTLTVSNAATVNVSGANAQIHVGDGYGAVAPGAVGTLNIQSGSVITVDHGTDASAGFATIIVGQQEFGTGIVNITGTGSKLVSLGHKNEIVIGDRGIGTFNVLLDADVEGQRMFVGANQGATGTVLIDGMGSSLTLSGPNIFNGAIDRPDLSVGNRGTGSMTVSNSAQINIVGAGAHLNVGDGYDLLAAGETGTLSILSGADVTVTNTDAINQRGAVDIGGGEFGSGTVTVSGVGSTLTAAGTDPFISVGQYGTGVLNVLTGGVVNSLSMSVGNEGGSNGDLNISGAGSKVILSNDVHTAGFNGDVYAGNLVVGNRDGAYGRADISAGGVLEIRNSVDGIQSEPALSIGNLQGAVGIVNVTGTGSAISITRTGDTFPGSPGQYGAFLGVGQRGDGTLIVSDNAQVNMTGESVNFRISRGNNDGEIGAPARVVLSEAFIQSGADLNLNAIGGTYYGAQLRVGGNQTNANGRMTVEGTGSTVNVIADNIGSNDAFTAKIVVGGQGQGDLVVRNGADIVVNGGDDKRAALWVAAGSTSIATMLVDGAGSTVNILTTNTLNDGGGFVSVGTYSGSNGSLTISNGGQLINDLGSTNSGTTVGGFGIYNAFSASQGTVVVDGNGIANTLFDAGQLLVIGADWNRSSSDLSQVNFFGGGIGSVAALDTGIVRANNVAIGSGGTLRGNSIIDGNVFLQGDAFVAGQGKIDAGTEVDGSIGRLTITGSLSSPSGTMVFDIAGTVAGVSHDQISVGGSAEFARILSIKTSGGFNFAAGNSFVLVDGAAWDPMIGPPSFLPQTVLVNGVAPTFKHLVGNSAGDLIFEALNNGSGPAIVEFGATSTNAVLGSLTDGSGLIYGGRFNGGVNVVGATTVRGTAAVDNITAFGLNSITLEGLAGGDNLTGGDGLDTLSGGTGSDTVLGGAGQDVILVGNGLVGDFDVLDGGTERDLLDMSGLTNGGIWIDYGYNVISGPNMASGFNLSMVVGEARVVNMDSMVGTGFNDTMRGDAGSNLIDGGAGNDILLSYSPYDTITPYSSLGDVMLGGSGDDLLFSGTGNDYLDGGANNDTLEVGGGTDTVITGTGNDTIFFSPRNGTDTVTDFTGGAGVVDVLKLYGFGTSLDTYAEVFSVSSQQGADTHIALTDTTIILQNFTRATLVADDFVFV
jgi:T5SS/PEP-CTERM-associated repeat protein